MIELYVDTTSSFSILNFTNLHHFSDMHFIYSYASTLLCILTKTTRSFLWVLHVNMVDNVPSVKTMEELNNELQHICGIDTIPYDGKLGHRYYVNNVSQILAQVCIHYFALKFAKH